MPITASYILRTEVDAYGVQSLSPQLLARASSMVDAVLRRPDGVIWAPDASGWPCYMARKQPSFSSTIAASIAPSTGLITIPVPGLPGTGDELTGDVVILDRNNANAVEACVIQYYKPGFVTLNSVAYAHTGPFTMDFGLTIMEECSMPSQRSVARLMETPVARVHSGVGRYSYGRRSDQMLGTYQDENLLATYAVLGGHPLWQTFSIDASSINPNTGEVWVPAGLLLAYFTEAKFRYVAGWAAAFVPEIIKQSTAQIALAVQGGQFPGNATTLKAGDHEIIRAVATVLDADMTNQLRMYRAHMLV